MEESWEIRRFAERVLYGRELADKMFHPVGLTDIDAGGEWRSPELPGRPAELAIGTGKRQAFPTAGKMDDERARGMVLHYFANHELLALELMAVCLLRFPNAPKAFRMGIVRTMFEEQDHLRLYQQRMHDFGVTFGEFPVNQFFWSAIADLDTPVKFIAAMSLTLEQANLDFSLYYQRLFAKVGDTQSAELMHQVYVDEIGHVAHGVRWFDTWRDPKLSAWEAYRELLEHPLTPRRAKGKIFDMAGRRRAGLDDDFVAKLRVYSSSRGRPPRVFYFDPTVETNLAGYSAKPAQADFRNDFAEVMMFLAQADDAILVPEELDTALLEDLQAAGFTLPERVVPAGWSQLLQRKWGGFEPWGWCPGVCKRVRDKEGLQIPSLEVIRRCVDKGTARQWRESFLRQSEDSFWGDATSASCSTYAEVLATLERLQAYEVCVLKAPFGASGQNMKRQVTREPLAANIKGWVEKVIRLQGHILVEPWLDRTFDIGLQIDTRRKQPLIGWSLYFTTAAGRMRGYVVGDKWGYIDESTRRLLHQGRAGGFRERVEELSHFVRDRLMEETYSGPAGIDAFVFSGPGGAKFRPLVEVNARYTMGHIALALERKIAPGRRAYWYWLFPADMAEMGYTDFSSFAKAMRARHAIDCSERGVEKGIFFTCDPERATATLGMVWVGEALPSAEVLAGFLV